MRFAHPDHPGRGVRLAYCLNLHAAEDLDGVLDGIERVTLPLAGRLFDLDAARAAGEAFGVGVWLPMDVALELAGAGAADGRLERFAGFLAERRLDAFTFNAFPAGGFHRPGLKQRVFQPTWKSPERAAYTLAVARIALAARRALGARATGSPHVSISTHAGMFGADVAGPDDLERCAEGFALCAAELARLEEQSGLRLVLSLEPEPRSSANDTAELAAFHARIRARAAADGHSLVSVQRPLGTCLDACHAAVEFEAPRTAFENATAANTPLGKLQFSSALSLADPDRNAAGRRRLFQLDEPVYLHQVTARGEHGFARVPDLPALTAAWRRADPRWRASDEWRCHFHVPVDLGQLGPDLGLTTTRPAADATLRAALAAPARWGTDELHVEIETYTWDVLPPDARGPGTLLDGLEREYRHVLALLTTAGWHPIVR